MAVEKTRSVKKDSIWLLLSIGSTKLLEFVTNVFLARLLLPRDFGLFGIVAVILGLVTFLGNWGIHTFIIYKNEESQRYLATAFWLNLAIAVFLSAIFWVSAPLTAYFFDEAVLVTLQRIVAFQFLCYMLGLIHMALLQKAMNFVAIAKINFFVLTIGLLGGVAMAFYGWGVYSLVVPGAFNAIAMALLYWISVGWLPALRFSKDTAREIIRYGRNIFGADFNAFLLQNLDFLIVGKLISISALGFYKLAFTLSMAFVGIMSEVVVKVLMPTFSQYSDNLKELRRLFINSTEHLAAVALPLFLGLTAIAPVIIPMLYGSKWETTIIPFQIFCFLGMFTVIYKPVNSLLNALGQPQIRYRYSLVFLPITLLLILAGLPWGLVGVTVGYTVATILFLLALFRRVVQLIEVSPMEIIGRMVKFIVPGMVMIALLILLKGSLGSLGAVAAGWLPSGISRELLQGVVALALMVAVGALTYFATQFMLFGATSKTFYKTLITGLKNR